MGLQLRGAVPKPGVGVVDPGMSPVPPGVYNEWRKGVEGLWKFCLKVASGFGGGGDDDHKRCLSAAKGDENKWNNFCESLKGGSNNTVGGQSMRRACWEKTYESRTSKLNWCHNQFGQE
jgi:hypothetical protein